MLYAGPQPDALLITFALSFLPSIILTIILRYTEKYEREPWGSIWTAFLWGSTGAVVLVILARGYFSIYLENNFPEIASNNYLMVIYISCLFTPIIAELLKLLGLFFVRDELDESEDGLIYGATIGLGFAATETMLYGIFLYSTYGFEKFIFTVLIRTASVALLHSSVGAIAGYSITRAIASKHKKGSLALFPVFMLISIGCHSIFNYIANSTITGSSVNISYTYALIFSIVIASVTWIIIWIKIIRLDRLDNKPKEKKPENGFSKGRLFSKGYTEDRPKRDKTGVGRGFTEDFGENPQDDGGDSRWAYSPKQLQERKEEQKGGSRREWYTGQQDGGWGEWDKKKEEPYGEDVWDDDDYEYDGGDDDYEYDGGDDGWGNSGYDDFDNDDFF